MADINLNINEKELIRAAKELQKAARDLGLALKKTGTTTQKDALSAKQFAKAVKQLRSEKNKLNAEQKEQLRLERALVATEAKIKAATSQTNKTLIEKKKQLLAINRQLRTGSKNTASWGKALGSFQFKFNALGNIAANVTSKITRSVNRAMRDAVRIVKDFDQAMADVKAVTGATGKEFDKLSNSAKKLGGITKFTASQVAGLQKAYAKLGFSTDEILKAQGATLDLAAATGTDLARAAEVAGITIRQFGLDASETQRVTDVMARSFTSSALDMEKFAEAMKFVGPAAKASGISIERATAMIGQLADAGISGSMAGTSLRQIMLALSKESGTLTEKLARTAEKGLDLAGAAEAVQKRAATALLVLNDGVDTIDDFTESLEGAAGAAREMADVQLDTLAGQATLVKSAWEGMILSMLSTEDNLNGVKWALGGIIDLLNTLAIKAETGLKFTDAMVIQKETSRAIADAMKEQEWSIDHLLTGWKGIGETFKEIGLNIWEQLFPKESGDNVITDLEDIDRLVKGLMDETLFKEDDQDAILLDQDTFWSDLYAAQLEKHQAHIARIAADNAKANEDSLKETKETEDKKGEILNDGFSRTSNLLNSISGAFAAAKEKELSAVGDNAAKREAIEIKYAKREQRFALASATINAAEAITQIWSKWAANPVVAGIFTAIAAGTLAGQIAIIKNQKFAEGEVDIKGPSHSRGGINAEIEGGESVINKRSTGKYKNLLDAINQDDQMRIMDAMGRDKKIQINGSSDPYTRKMYELMQSRHSYGEDDKFYYKQVGNALHVTPKE